METAIHIDNHLNDNDNRKEMREPKVIIGRNNRKSEKEGSDEKKKREMERSNKKRFHGELSVRDITIGKKKR